MTWLVTGGAGYIGAHTVRELLATGRRVVVLDDLSTGDPRRLPAEVALVVAPVHDRATVLSTLLGYGVRGVVHLAARKSVEESVRRPDWYHAQNVGGLACLLSAMCAAGVHRLVFSSSAAVYGTPTGRVTETSPVCPVNPYGRTKLLGEHMIGAAARQTPLRWAALRYFNVAGAACPRLADTGGENLIPLALTALRTGDPLTVTGADYPTRDGSGVRDYVHVLDVARAYGAAVARLCEDGPCGDVVNVGTGRGYSVLEVLRGLGEVAGVPVPYRLGPRRAGDPAEVVADVERIRRVFGWVARYGLTEMLASSWQASGAPVPPARELAVSPGG